MLCALRSFFMKKNDIVVLLFLFLFFYPVPTTTHASSLREDAVVRAVRETSPAVVNISTEQLIARNVNPLSPFFNDPYFEKFFKDFFEPGYEKKYTQKSLGSGVIFEKRGYILTNWHVVEKATQIKVILINEEIFNAKLIGSSPELDLAVLKIEAQRNLPTIKIGDSDHLMIGEKVIAIGNPFGLSHTVTTGVISAQRRSLRVGENVYLDFIQTDASINPGNSGGPLLNIDGELVGINTAIYGEGAQGIGFAIPINKAKRVVDDLITYGEVSPAWIGIKLQTLSSEMSNYLGYHNDGEGVLVKETEPGSPAEKDGIEKTDIIIKIENEKVKTKHDFWAILSQYTSNETIPVTLFRKGQIVTLAIKAEKFPLARAEEYFFNLLGIQVQKGEPTQTKPKANAGTMGIAIARVRDKSRAYNLGIKPGDLILQINETSINSFSDFQKSVAGIFQKDAVLLLIQRGFQGYYLTIPFENE